MRARTLLLPLLLAALCGAAPLRVPVSGDLAKAICALPGPLAVRVLDFLRSPLYSPLTLAPAPGVAAAPAPKVVQAAVSAALVPSAAERWAEVELKAAPLVADAPLRQALTQAAAWTRRQLPPAKQEELDLKMRRMSAALGTATADESTLASDPDPESFARKHALLEKPSGAPKLQPVDLERSIAASGLAGRMAEIRAHARGGMTIYDYLRGQGRMQRGYVLGLSLHRDAYPLVGKMTGLTTWDVAYRGIFGRVMPDDHTRLFMDHITRSGQPIVMLVPDDYAGHPRGKLTRDEIDWLLADPKNRMKNVTFVFGAYDMMSERDYAEFAAARRSLDERIAALSQALKP